MKYELLKYKYIINIVLTDINLLSLWYITSLSTGKKQLNAVKFKCTVELQMFCYKLESIHFACACVLC